MGKVVLEDPGICCVCCHSEDSTKVRAAELRRSEVEGSQVLISILIQTCCLIHRHFGRLDPSRILGYSYDTSLASGFEVHQGTVLGPDVRLGSNLSYTMLRCFEGVSSAALAKRMTDEAKCLMSRRMTTSESVYFILRSLALAISFGSLNRSVSIVIQRSRFPGWRS
jgi:hypothetical protein